MGRITSIAAVIVGVAVLVGLVWGATSVALRMQEAAGTPTGVLPISVPGTTPEPTPTPSPSPSPSPTPSESASPSPSAPQPVQPAPPAPPADDDDDDGFDDDGFEEFDDD